MLSCAAVLTGVAVLAAGSTASGAREIAKAGGLCVAFAADSIEFGNAVGDACNSTRYAKFKSDHVYLIRNDGSTVRPDIGGTATTYSKPLGQKTRGDAQWDEYSMGVGVVGTGITTYTGVSGRLVRAGEFAGLFMTFKVWEGEYDVCMSPASAQWCGAGFKVIAGSFQFGYLAYAFGPHAATMHTNYRYAVLRTKVDLSAMGVRKSEVMFDAEAYATYKTKQLEAKPRPNNMTIGGLTVSLPSLFAHGLVNGTAVANIGAGDVMILAKDVPNENEAFYVDFVFPTRAEGFGVAKGYAAFSTTVFATPVSASASSAASSTDTAAGAAAATTPPALGLASLLAAAFVGFA